MMPAFRHLLCLALPLASVVLGQANPQPSNTAAANGEAKQMFQDLLNAIPEESLHSALDDHMRPKYQNGVFEFDKAAVEKIHDDNPGIASKLVIYAAKLELLKRQGTNATTTQSSSSSSPAPSSAQSTPPEGISSTSTTSISTSSSLGTTASSSLATSSTISSPITESSGTGTSTVAPQSTVAVPATTSSSTGEATVPSTSSTGAAAATSNTTPTTEVLTTTDSRGSTLVTTFTPVSSKVLLTTTLPNGNVETITSYTFVQPTPDQTSASGAATGSRGAPSLQSGAANVLSRGWGAEAAALVGGAVGVAWLM